MDLSLFLLGFLGHFLGGGRAARGGGAGAGSRVDTAQRNISQRLSRRSLESVSISGKPFSIAAAACNLPRKSHRAYVRLSLLHESSRHSCRKCTGQLVQFVGRVSIKKGANHKDQTQTKNQPPKKQGKTNQQKHKDGDSLSLEIKLECTCIGQTESETEVGQLIRAKRATRLAIQNAEQMLAGTS